MSDAPVWDDGRWPGLAPLVDDVNADACVVGLGGSGLACVLELVSHGQRVVGIDARRVASGAAGRNGGFLLAGLPAFYHRAVETLGREVASAVYLRTVSELDRMTTETPEAIRRTGSLRIAEDDTEFADCQRQFDAMRADNLPVERYEGAEGRGLLIPTDGAFDPMLRCRALARRTVANGALLFEESPAVEISTGEVRTPQGTVNCRTVIVAVDGRLECVLPELRGRVRTARLQMLATAPAPEVELPRPVYQRWGYEYWQQLPDGRVAVGGLRDQGGDAEWTTDAVPSDALQHQLDRILRDHIGVRAPVTHRWAGVVGYTESGMPIVDEVRPGVWAIGGYNGTGNVLGAICGRGVAELVVTGQSPLLEGLRQ